MNLLPDCKVFKFGRRNTLLLYFMLDVCVLVFHSWMFSAEVYCDRSVQTCEVAFAVQVCLGQILWQIPQLGSRPCVFLDQECLTHCNAVPHAPVHVLRCSLQGENKRGLFVNLLAVFKSKPCAEISVSMVQRCGRISRDTYSINPEKQQYVLCRVHDAPRHVRPPPPRSCVIFLLQRVILPTIVNV